MTRRRGKLKNLKTKFILLSVPDYDWFQDFLKDIMTELQAKNESLSNYLIGLAIKEFYSRNLLSAEEKADWEESFGRRNIKPKKSNLEKVRLLRFSLYMPKKLQPWFYAKLELVTNDKSSYFWSLLIQDNKGLDIVEANYGLWLEHYTKKINIKFQRKEVA